ncbi:S41 family peptidase [Herbinix luporum]|uniref:S41 family peptidase n=1 Tax=Herbinix luporum TaxID=1679721 RepID=UPI0023F4F280|nr:S41 family peptidase [Herbinix luporum]
MKKNYLTGFLTGLCGALLVFMLMGTAYFRFFYAPRLQTVPIGDTKVSEDEEEPYGHIVSKLSVLQMLIDTYYLDEVDNEALATGIYKGFVAGLNDPYSTYYTKEEFSNLQESSSGVYHGIGAVVSQDRKTGVITIVRPYKDGPAYKVGLLPDDIIYKVEGEEVTGKDLAEVVSKMKGKEGTKVNISIIRDGEAEPIDFTIVRQKINIPTIEYEMLEDDIGYIQIIEFDEITVSQFNEAIDKLEKMGMKGLVVDVRNNPGGLLESVVQMLDRLIFKGLIVYTEDKYHNREEERAEDPNKFDKPLAVLINGNSASASEIFAGAIQDYEIGTVVGTTSFGKGIVQKIIPLSDGTAVKLTISNYFTPKGRSLNGTGVEPDIEVELLDELKQLVTIPHDKDNQLQKAIEVIKEQIQ